MMKNIPNFFLINNIWINYKQVGMMVFINLFIRGVIKKLSQGHKSSYDTKHNIYCSSFQINDCLVLVFTYEFVKKRKENCLLLSSGIKVMVTQVRLQQFLKVDDHRMY